MAHNNGIKPTPTGTACTKGIVSLASGHFFLSAYAKRYAVTDNKNNYAYKQKNNYRNCSYLFFLIYFLFSIKLFSLCVVVLRIWSFPNV
ncbi:MAG: hypothetical protein ACYDBT_15675 [Desulfobulbaceae bacterium]